MVIKDLRSKKNSHTKKIKLLTTVAIVSTLIAAGYKVNKLSEEPLKSKNCTPIAHQNTHTEKSIVFNLNENTRELENKLDWEQKGGSINDVSCLNKTPVYGIVNVRSEEDIKNAIILAKETGLKISMAGVKHSMGGQAFFKNNIVLNMTNFNNIQLNTNNGSVRVQSGATWHDIQNQIHPRFAVKSMQSTDIFTVGGSISVNAHGMDHIAGSVGSSIRSMRIILASGELIEIGPQKNQELFNLVVGGYGLFGVIVDADLEVVKNDIYRTERNIIDYKEFTNIFDHDYLNNQNVGLFYGHLSTAKSSLLREMILYKYEKVELNEASIPPLTEIRNVRLRRFIFNLSKHGTIPMNLKWYMEKKLEPRLETCTIVARTSAMSEGESCFVSRNEPMHDSVKYLKNSFPNETDILHEYFIPKDKFVTFVDGIRKVVRDNNVNLLNASVRVVHPEKNFLSYSPSEMYSVVLYINQKTDKSGNEKMKAVTEQLIGLTLDSDGRFFLPYQLHYTPEQLKKSYPEIGEFFKQKEKFDPDKIFTNTFYEKYFPLVS